MQTIPFYTYRENSISFDFANIFLGKIVTIAANITITKNASTKDPNFAFLLNKMYNCEKYVNLFAFEYTTYNIANFWNIQTGAKIAVSFLFSSEKYRFKILNHWRPPIFETSKERLGVFENCLKIYFWRITWVYLLWMNIMNIIPIFAKICTYNS